jgi:predicted nucleic acid-binding protein
MFDEDLADHDLPFDDAAASHYAEIVVSRRLAGVPIEAFDALIARYLCSVLI